MGCGVKKPCSIISKGVFVPRLRFSSNCLWEILQNCSAGELGVVCHESGKVVAATTADVDDERGSTATVSAAFCIG